MRLGSPLLSSSAKSTKMPGGNIVSIPMVSERKRLALIRKSIVWIALFAVPFLYALARCTAWPWSLVLSLLLHWGLACTVLAWTSICLNGPQDIGLRRALPGFLCFVFVIGAYSSGLIVWFGSRPLADWQYHQMPLGRWGVILTAISAGFCEEVIYRGYMMTALKKAGQPVWAAMILSTISFVVFHGKLPIPFMLAFFIIGMIFAAMYHKTSILWVTIFVHGLWDATVLLIPMGAGTP